MFSRFSGGPTHVDRQRDRDRHRPAPYPRDDILGCRPGGNKNPPYNRIFVSNIPYEEKWQKIKDLFRDEVGEVTYAEVMTDDNGRSKGFGIVEFKTEELAMKAVEKMKDFQIQDRKLVVKEDFYGHIMKKALRRESTNRPRHRDGRIERAMPSRMPLPTMPPPMPVHDMPPPMPIHNMPHPSNSHSAQRSVDDMIQKITGGAPIGNTIFITNLDYSVSYSKLKEVFSLAGSVVKVNLHLDHENISKGMATITYQTPLEALEAISMFNKQLLYDRPMLIKMDRGNAQQPEKRSLPSGLQSIGPSLNISSPGEDLQRGSSSRMDCGGGLLELEMLAAKKKLLESKLDINLSGLSGTSANQFGSRSVSGIHGFLKPKLEASSGLNFASHNPSYSLSNNPTLAGLAAALGLRGVSSETNLRHGYGNNPGDRTSTFGGQGINVSDRQRIDSDIARVDSRIRDLDRSLKSAEGRLSNTAWNSDSCTVFVKNLPFNLSWQNLREKFSRVGNVTYANIKVEDGRSKGFGHVRYESPEEAMIAVRHFNGADIDGRKIVVRLDDDKFSYRR